VIAKGFVVPQPRSFTIMEFAAAAAVGEKSELYGLVINWVYAGRAGLNGVAGGGAPLTV
jgi:hypothetical protein